MEKSLPKTLITGGKGMVGSYFDFGVKTDHRSLDITDLKSALEFCSREKPGIIIHLAAETDMDRCERDPMHGYNVNTIGTYNMALAAKKAGATLVYISTGAVFNGEKGNYTEDDEPDPRTFYGRSKYLAELIVSGMSNNHLIIRAGWIFGGGPERDKKFVAKIMGQLDTAEIKAVTDKMGSPTYAKDFAKGIKGLLAEGRRGLFNLSNKGAASRYEVAKEIVQIVGSSVKVTPVDSSYFNLEAHRGHSEAIVSSKISPMRPWQEALREYIKEEWRNK